MTADEAKQAKRIFVLQSNIKAEINPKITEAKFAELLPKENKMTSDEAQAPKISHYEYKNNKYNYLCSVMMKCPDSGIWRNAVMYEDINGNFFVREKFDFDLKFKKMEIMG